MPEARRSSSSLDLNISCVAFYCIALRSENRFTMTLVLCKVSCSWCRCAINFCWCSAMAIVSGRLAS